MDRPGLVLDEEQHRQAADAQGRGESHHLSILRCSQWLVHACRCPHAGCSLPPCQKLKRVVQHTKGCKWRNNGGCPVCKQLIALCCFHAKLCQDHTCPVLLCPHIKQKLRQAQMLRRRTASGRGHGAGVVGQQQGPPSPTPATPAPLQPPFPGLPLAAVEMARDGQRAAERERPMALGQAFQRPQMTPMAPVGMNPPPTARGPGGCPEPGLGPTGTQQQPPWAQGGSIQPLQPQPGAPGPAAMSAAPQGQPWSTAPGSGLGQVPVPSPKPGSVSPHTLQSLLRILRSPFSPLQQQQVLSILRANPQLLVAFIRQRIAQHAHSNPQPPLGVHTNPAAQNRQPTQAGAQTASLPQQQPWQLLQPPVEGLNVNLDTSPAQSQDVWGLQQRAQQKGIHHELQQPAGAGYPPPQQQQQMQQMLPHGQQVGQLPQALGAEAGASLQAHQQQMGAPEEPLPLSLQQPLLPSQAQPVPSLSNQGSSPQPVSSPRPPSQPPSSSASPRMQPQLSPQHVAPQTDPGVADPHGASAGDLGLSADNSVSDGNLPRALDRH